MMFHSTETSSVKTLKCGIARHLLTFSRWITRPSGALASVAARFHPHRHTAVDNDGKRRAREHAGGAFIGCHDRSLMDFMDIPSRVKLARCNTSLQRQVYQECRRAWIEIRFGAMAEVHRDNVTDRDLSILIARVNAREVTRLIGLQNCRKIDGSGLTPLKNSRVLHLVDLLATNMSDNPVPAQHDFIHILCCNPSRRIFSKPSDIILDFMRQPRQGKTQSSN